ncbi:MAG: hypothetical protein P8X67_21505, partial [Syntrophobacterales bacterium]
PPHTPPLYRAFKGNQFSPSGKLDELDRLSPINGAIFSTTRPEPRTRLDLVWQQSERSPDRQLNNLIILGTPQEVRFGIVRSGFGLGRSALSFSST